MDITLLGNISLIHMLGDSHTLQFAETFFEANPGNHRFFCKQRYMKNLFAEHYMVGDELNPVVRDVLIADGLFNKNGLPNWLNPDWSTWFLAGRPVLPPAIVFFGGEVNVQNILFRSENKFDFELPDDPGYGVNYDKEPMPFKMVQTQIENQMGPYVAAIKKLRASFPRIMVHALPPRTRDDARAKRWSFEIQVDAPFRAKTAVAVNRYLAQACKAMDVAFIDPPELMGEDGYMRPQFELDGLHVAPAGIKHSLEHITATIFDRTSAIANPTRYSVLRSDSRPYTGPRTADEATWAERGYISGQLGEAAIAGLDENLQFVAAPSNRHASPEWVGHARAGRPEISVAEPSEGVLQRAFDLLREGLGRSLIQAGAPTQMTIASFRPVEVNPGVRTTPSSLASPSGCRRALLSLDGAGSAMVQSFADGKIVSEMTLDAGSLVVFDPSRVACFIEAGVEPARFVEMTIVPQSSSQPFRAIWAGLNDWPADPFHYTVAGMRAYPPFESDTVRERS